MTINPPPHAALVWLDEDPKGYECLTIEVPCTIASTPQRLRFPTTELGLRELRRVLRHRRNFAAANSIPWLGTSATPVQSDLDKSIDRLVEAEMRKRKLEAEATLRELGMIP